MSEKTEKQDHLDWADSKYRPKSFEEIVGNQYSVGKMKKYAENGNFPHLLLSGPPGVGKTCCAEILCASMNAEVKEWNASDESRIEVVRKDVKSFVRTRPLDVPFKIAFLDESNRFSKSTQEVLRRLMEKYSDNCRFVMTTNDHGAMIPPIVSRTKSVFFTPLTPDDIMSKLCEVGKKENLEEIITEEQLYKIATASRGDMRAAIKTMQSLCENRRTPITDSEIKVEAPSVNAQTIENAVRAAMNGEFTESYRMLKGLSGYMTIESIFYEVENLILKPNVLKENEKIVLGLALERVISHLVHDRRQLIGMLAFLADNSKRGWQ